MMAEAIAVSVILATFPIWVTPEQISAWQGVPGVRSGRWLPVKAKTNAIVYI